MGQLTRKIAFLLLVSVATLVFAVSVSATEIESGYMQVTSTGGVTEDIGFRPDYIEFITAQQITTVYVKKDASIVFLNHPRYFNPDKYRNQKHQ